MSDFEFRGPVEHTYPQYQHPDGPGVLVVEPGEIIDFGDRLPPGDGQWYDSDGSQVLPVVPSEEEPAGEQAPAAEPETVPKSRAKSRRSGPGTGTDDQGEET